MRTHIWKKKRQTQRRGLKRPALVCLCLVAGGALACSGQAGPFASPSALARERSTESVARTVTLFLTGLDPTKASGRLRLSEGTHPRGCVAHQTVQLQRWTAPKTWENVGISHE